MNNMFIAQIFMRTYCTENEFTAALTDNEQFLLHLFTLCTLGPAYNNYKDAKETTRCNLLFIVT